ncbi:unnamed protein product [Bursaphelenchus xylophilus]|uniref:(pine wood nematode) hypothetical protein n=1 Tax=Bursaphelenchus xylophilus TaxID=6326 RepID=A0A1I7S0Q0_BURXY|nr:unnamed protein product [Bursaphelenchus xylophilus]CAG9088235.1 unnamed protein product [Bursaphelenchus xylophilus]
MIAIVLVALLAFARADDVKLQCLQPPKINSALPAAIAIPQNYSAIVTFVDSTKTSVRLVEKDFNDVFFYEKTQKGQKTTRYVVKDNSTLIFDDTSCSRQSIDESKKLYPFPKVFTDTFKDLSTLSQIVNSVLTQQYAQDGLVNVTSVDGFTAVTWHGCLNRTDTTDAIEIDVNFIGDKSTQPPFDDGNKWPQALNIHFLSYNYTDDGKGTITPSIKEDITVSILVLKPVDQKEKVKVSSAPKGVFCENSPKAVLPSGLPTKFEADLTYIDSEQHVVNTAELMYDQPNRIVSFGLDFSQDSDIPYVQNTNTSEVKDLGKARIFLDFKSGFEYRLSKDGRVCRSVRPIEKSWQAIEEKDGKFNLKEPTTVFFNGSGAEFYNSGEVVRGGVTYDSYVSRQLNNATKEQVVIELLYFNKQWKLESGAENLIHSITQYHKNAQNETVKTTVILFNQVKNNTLVGTSWSKHTVFPCLADGKSDNFFFLKLANGTMKDLQNIGYENVESALAEAVAKTANISVLRISQFLLKQLNTQFMACFLLGEKNPLIPANTTDLVIEKNVTEVRNLLNGTLKTQQINVNIVSDDLKTQTISVNGFGVVSTTDEHPFPPQYNGYTGGSMFILALFSFIFGVGIAVGSYVFYTKRQGIRGIAYQVFE